MQEGVGRLGEGCRHWLASNLSHLTGGADRPARDQRPLLKAGAYKVIGEIALALMICGRSGTQNDQPDYQRLLDGFEAAVAHFRPPFEAASSCVRYLLSVTLALEANGKEAARFRDLLQRLLRQDVLHLHDETPWGILSLTYFLDLCAIQHDFPGRDDLYRLSILNSRPPLHVLGTHDKYAVSHLLFFLGDFGVRRDFFSSRPDHRVLCDFVEEITASCLLDEDWDLVGEYLIGFDCIARTDSPVATFAWSEYLTRQLSDGRIDAPRRLLKSLDDPVDHPTDLFHLHYHQTLVGLIAATLYAARRD